MSKVIKFAVIGIGNIGIKHVRVIKSTPLASLVAVCDIDKNKQKSLNELCAENIPFYTDFKKMLLSTDADIITIATPHSLHAQMSIESLKAGKHVLVEKPMALTVKDSKLMIATALNLNKKLFVVKQNRYNKPVLLTNKALKENRLGKIFLVQANVLWNRHEDYYAQSPWRGVKSLEGGALHTQVSHFIDLLMWWFGDILEAKTFIKTLNHSIEIEDTGVAALKFKTGILGSLVWTTNVYNKNYEGSITIIGEKGTIRIGGKYLNKIDFWDVQSYPLPENGDSEDKVNIYSAGYQGTASNHDKMMDEIIDFFNKGRKGVVEGDEGLKTTKAIEVIYANS